MTGNRLPALPPDDGPIKQGDDMAALVLSGWEQGKSQSELSRQLKVTRYRIGKIADELGIRFNAAATAAATQAAAAQSRRWEVELEHRWVSAAHHALDQADDADHPDDQFHYTRLAAIATDKAAVIGKVNADRTDYEAQGRMEEATSALRDYFGLIRGDTA